MKITRRQLRRIIAESIRLVEGDADQKRYNKILNAYNKTKQAVKDYKSANTGTQTRKKPEYKKELARLEQLANDAEKAARSFKADGKTFDLTNPSQRRDASAAAAASSSVGPAATQSTGSTANNKSAPAAKTTSSTKTRKNRVDTSKMSGETKNDPSPGGKGYTYFKSGDKIYIIASPRKGSTASKTEAIPVRKRTSSTSAYQKILAIFNK